MIQYRTIHASIHSEGGCKIYFLSTSNMASECSNFTHHKGSTVHFFGWWVRQILQMLPDQRLVILLHPAVKLCSADYGAAGSLWYHAETQKRSCSFPQPNLYLSSAIASSLSPSRYPKPPFFTALHLVLNPPEPDKWPLDTMSALWIILLCTSSTCRDAAFMFTAVFTAFLVHSNQLVKHEILYATMIH